jgi:hypothetical protein
MKEGVRTSKRGLYFLKRNDYYYKKEVDGSLVGTS